MRIVGLDIGGANLKACDREGRAISRCFPMWKEYRRLSDALRELLSSFEKPDVLAVTMTAELADCFDTKAEGVDFILKSVEQVAGNTPVFVWQTGAEFVTPQVAREIPLLVAAANWHALATWVGRIVPGGPALLIDIGSTTTDVIPLLDGIPVTAGLTDVERLQSGELVYTGVRRTPVCAIAPRVPFRGGECPLAAELFATTLDIYLLLGRIAESAADADTANGKPAALPAAHDRLARMLCCDRVELSREETVAVASFLMESQKRRIAGAIDQVLDAQGEVPGRVLIAGSGTFLAEEIVREHPRLGRSSPILLTNMLKPEAAEAACALAVARLAAERL